MNELLGVLRGAVTRGELLPQLTDGLVYAWINGSIRPSDYRAITGRTGPSATRDLGHAVRAEYLTASGETKSRRYFAGPRLQGVKPVPVASRVTER